MKQTADNSKYLITIAVTLAIIFFFTAQKASAAMAGGSCYYSPTLQSHKTTLAIDAMVNGRRVMAQDTSDRYQSMASLGGAMVRGLESTISSRLGAELSRVSEYNGHSVDVAGPIKLSIEGKEQTKSQAKLSFGRMSVGASFKKTKRFLFIRVSAQCDIRMEATNPTMIGDYDLYSGQLFVRSSQMNVRHSQDCSSSFDWIPILGSYINRKIESKVDSLLTQTTLRLSNALESGFTSNNFMGLNAIPAGTLVVQGLDVGQLLKTKLVDLIQSNRIEVELKEPETLPTVRYEDFRVISSTPFKVSFLDASVHISVSEAKAYHWQLRSRGFMRCLEP